MEYLQPYIYNIVCAMLKEREVSHTVPIVASHNEVLKRVLDDVRDTISELEDDGVLGHSENVNGIYLYRIHRELKHEEDNVQ